jgi:hypothetical protein
MTVRRNGFAGSFRPALNGIRSNSGKTVWIASHSPAQYVTLRDRQLPSSFKGVTEDKFPSLSVFNVSSLLERASCFWFASRFKNWVLALHRISTLHRGWKRDFGRVSAGLLAVWLRGGGCPCFGFHGEPFILKRFYGPSDKSSAAAIALVKPLAVS